MITLILALIFAGPLADRQVPHAPVNGQGVVMMVVEVTLSQKLYAHGPIAVLAPGSDHLGYGVEGSPTGAISMFRFNLRLERAAHEPGGLASALSGTSPNGLARDGHARGALPRFAP